MDTGGSPAWTPANDVERAMAGSLSDGDPAVYFRVIAEAPLYLPAFAGSGPQRLVTCRRGEDTCLVVFTSPEAMAARLVGVELFRTTSYPELAEKWPDPGWLLAVDPGLPIQGYMPIN